MTERGRRSARQHRRVDAVPTHTSRQQAMEIGLVVEAVNARVRGYVEGALTVPMRIVGPSRDAILQ